jgi:predicted small lipoprotein YifL
MPRRVANGATDSRRKQATCPEQTVAAPRRAAYASRPMKTFIVIAALLALAACKQEGPAEKAGRQLDQAGEKASRNIEQAGKDVRDAVSGKK